MMIPPRERKAWRSPNLQQVVPDAELIREVLAANGLREVPPALSRLLPPQPPSGEQG